MIFPSPSVFSRGAQLVASALYLSARTRTVASRRKRALIASRLNTRLLPSLGVKIESRLRSPLALDWSRPLLVVSNHVSFLDVMIYSSIFEGRFVTSDEIRRAPIAGAVCEAAGCLFIERRARRSIIQSLDQLVLVLQQGDPVIVFPEATSTSGDQMRPLKGWAFQAAIQSQAQILPIYISYDQDVGLPVEEPLPNHIFKLLGKKSTRAILDIGSVLDASHYIDRDVLRREVQESLGRSERRRNELDSQLATQPGFDPGVNLDQVHGHEPLASTNRPETLHYIKAQ